MLKRIIPFVLLFLMCSPVYAERVSDQVGIFSAEQKQSVDVYHQKLLEVYDIDYRVLTVAGADDINVLATKFFAAEKVGSLGKTGRGLLLVVNPEQNQVRLEVSKGLEAVYTDAFVSYIQHRQMILFFKAGRVSDGILATTELIFARAAEATAGKSFDPLLLEGSAGGGVTNKAGIGTGMEEKSTKVLSPDVASAASPDQIVVAYLTTMQSRNSNPDLPIYSEETKQMQKNWVVTPAQMDMVVKTYAACAHDKTLIDSSKLAVVRYKLEDRACAPYFLVFEDGGWKLDLTMMQKAIRFNHMNQWHFDVRAAHPYGFAFQDWNFDGHGFPQKAVKLRWQLSVGTYQDIGTIVERVGKDSPAEKIGFQAGDQILKWNELDHPHYTQVVKYLHDVEPGAVLIAVINRQGTQMTLKGEAPPRP